MGAKPRVTMAAEAIVKSQEPYPCSANLVSETAESRTGHYLPKPSPALEESNAQLRPTVCSSAPSQGQFPGSAPLPGGQLTKHDLAFQQPQARPRGYPPRHLRGKASPKETMPPDLEQGWGSRERQIC